MAVKFEFSLSDKDFNKLRLLKRADGETDMTFSKGGGAFKRCYRQNVP